MLTQNKQNIDEEGEPTQFIQKAIQIEPPKVIITQYTQHPFSYQIKEKGSDENSWDRLIDRNPILTIYKLAMQNINKMNQSLIDVEQVKPNEKLRDSITWLYNKQQTLKQRNDRLKQQQNDKYLLKHILTYDQRISLQIKYSQFGEDFGNIIAHNYKINDDKVTIDFINQFYPLYHYITEAVDKQQEGVINNALFIIQPEINTNFIKDDCPLNYFTLAVGAQIHTNSRQCKEVQMKTNKVVLINLTGEESILNLEFLSSLLGNEDSYYYYSFIKIDQQTDLVKHQKEYQKYYDQMRNDPKCKIQLIPFYYIDLFFPSRYFLVFFENFMYKTIQKFNPSYIALSLRQSDKFVYEDYLLQKVIKSLKDMSFNKLILHIDFPEWNETKDIHQQQQLLNKCYTAFTNFKEPIPKCNDENYLVLLENTLKLYEMFKLDKHSDHIKTNITAALLVKQGIQKLKDTEEKQPILDTILYKNNHQIKIISVKLQDGDCMTTQTEVKVYYEQQIILLYQKQIDNMQSYLYFKDISEDLNKNPENIFITVEFKKLNLQHSTCDYTLAQLVNPIVFLKNHAIYFLYGTYEVCERTQLNTTLFSYQIQSQTWSQGNILQQQPQKSFSNKVGFDLVGFDHKYKKFNEKTQETIARVKSQRASPTVCFVTPFSQEQKGLLIFSGENYLEPEIMNYVELIEIFNDGQYCSGKLDKIQLYKYGTLKPYPNQIILEGKINDFRVHVFLPGNDHMREQKFNYPINTQHSQKVSILKASITDTQIVEQPINYFGDIYFNLSDLSNKQYNQNLLFCGENTLVWRVIHVCAVKQSSKKKRNIISFPSSSSEADSNQSQQKGIEQQINTQEIQNSIQFMKAFSQVPSELDVITSFFEEKEGEKAVRDQIKQLYLIMQETQKKSDSNNEKDEFQVEQTYQKSQQNKLQNLRDDVYILNEKMETEQEQQKNNNPLFKHFVVNETEITTVGYESYIFYDFVTNEIKVKQFSYELKQPYTPPKFDISERNNLILPYLTDSQKTSQSIEFKQGSQSISKKIQPSNKN